MASHEQLQKIVKKIQEFRHKPMDSDDEVYDNEGLEPSQNTDGDDFEPFNFDGHFGSHNTAGTGSGPKLTQQGEGTTR